VNSQKPEDRQPTREKTAGETYIMGAAAAPQGPTGWPRGSSASPPSAPDPASAQRPGLGCSLPGLTRFTRLQPTRPPTEAHRTTAGPTGQSIDGEIRDLPRGFPRGHRGYWSLL